MRKYAVMAKCVNLADDSKKDFLVKLGVYDTAKEAAKAAAAFLEKYEESFVHVVEIAIY